MVAGSIPVGGDSNPAKGMKRKRNVCFFAIRRQRLLYKAHVSLLFLSLCSSLLSRSTESAHTTTRPLPCFAQSLKGVSGDVIVLEVRKPTPNRSFMHNTQYFSNHCTPSGSCVLRSWIDFGCDANDFLLFAFLRQTQLTRAFAPMC